MSNKASTDAPAWQPWHALTVAGSDSCGGAGIQADLKTMNSLGVEAASVITAITAQNTLGVQALQVLPPELVVAQFDAVMADLPIAAIKTGMLANAAIIEALAVRLGQSVASTDARQRAADSGAALILDPVMVSTSGARLLEADAEQALVATLLPMATLVTPNLPEAAVLTGLDPDSDPRALAEAILALGAAAVLIKGGHGRGTTVVDLLITASAEYRFESPRVSDQMHGTGCSLAAAIAARMARGDRLPDAVGGAIAWLQQRIARRWRPRAGPLAMLALAARHED